MSHLVKSTLQVDDCTPYYVTDPHSYLEGGYVTQYGVEKDFQRSRLYTSEDYVCAGQEVRDISAYVEQVYLSKWVREHFPLCIPPTTHLSTFKNSYYYPNTHHIALCRKHTYERIILHELAHSLVPKPHAYHGRMFCAVYLDLVRLFMNKSIAISLEDSMQVGGVRFLPRLGT